MYVHLGAETRRVQKRALKFMDLELETVERCPIWMGAGN